MRRTKGEGSVYKNEKKNLWVAQYTDRDNENKAIRKSEYFKTREEAKQRLIEIQYLKNNKEYITKNGIPIITIVKQNRERKYNANIIGEGQYYRLGHSIKKIEEHKIGHMNIDEITEEIVQDFLNEHKYLSNSYIKQLHSQLNQAFKYAKKNKYIKDNPLEDILKPKSNNQTKKVKALTIEQQKLLTKTLLNNDIEKTKYKNAFLMQLYMGLRIGEILALFPSEIDLKNNMLLINRTLTKDKQGKVIMGDTTKTYAGKRELPIPNFLKGVFKEQLKIAEKNETDLLFTEKKGFVNPTNVNARLKVVLKNIGLNEEEYSTHSLRHSYGTRCIEAGMPPVVLQRLLGHTDIRITLNTYTDVLNKFKEEQLDKVNHYYKQNNFFEEIER